MVKARRIPTTMSSGAHLVRALESVGLREVERFPEPEPLLSWRNQPLPELAEIIVRRRQIGATADDLGFARTANGTYEAIVSEILLSRFDRRWFAELEKRYAALVAAEGPERDVPPPPRSVARAPAPEFTSIPKPAPAPAKPAPAPAPAASPSRSPARPEFVMPGSSPAARDTLAEVAAERPQLERDLAAVLGAATRAAKIEGCLPLFFGWMLFAWFTISTESGLLFVVGTVVAVFLLAKRNKQRQARMAEAAAAEFRSRFGSNPSLRGEATRRLRNELEKLSPDRRRVVELLLKRIGG